MKKGNKWLGYLFGLIAVLAVSTALIVWLVTAIRDHDAKQLEKEQQVKELVEKE